MYEFFLDSLRKYISLTEEQATLITDRLQLRKVRKKQWLVTPGEYCKSEFFVNRGCFRAYYIDDTGNQQDELYDDLPQLNKYFRLVYQKALANTSGRLLRTISGTAEQHYSQFIGQYPNIEQRVPQYMIASYLGITPEFLSKIKSRMLRG